MAKLEVAADNERISRAQSGDTESIENIIKSGVSLVEVIASKYKDSSIEKEDLVQEGMIGLFKAVESYDSSKGASFKTYANACINNAIQDAIKKTSRQKDIPAQNVVEYQEEEIPIMNSETSAEDIYIEKERLEDFYKAVEEKLSKLEKEVLVLYITGLSYGEISSRLDKDEKAIDNALQRIKKKLLDVK